MTARRITLEPGADWADGLAEWARVLRDGGVTAFATDTVWGLGALARDAAAIERIYALKGRADTRPMACLVRDAAMARDVVGALGDAVEAVTRRHWPGALTVVVPAPGRFPAAQRGLTTLGVRVPDRRSVLDLLERVGEPLAATSANKSGEPELPDGDAVLAELGDGVDLVVDDRTPVRGMASTVLEWGGSNWRVLRQGAVTLDTITSGSGTSGESER